MIEICHFWFNVFEAAMWIVMATWFLYLVLRGRSNLKKVFLAFSVTLYFFGISDIIETQTGAWYKPVGLFMLKAVCVLVIAGSLYVLFRNRSECERVLNGKTDD